MAKFIDQSYEILDVLKPECILRKLEMCGRVSYKSEEKMTEDSAIRFLRNIIKRGHESVLEHFSFSVKFITDRGVSHEIVRHRLASYTQESTRYCNYSNDKFGNELTFIRPSFFKGDRKIETGFENEPILVDKLLWEGVMRFLETSYIMMIKSGCKPEEARSILPNSIKTEIVCTMNIREWRHFFKLRTDKAAHPQMRELVIPLLKELQNTIPVLFEDIIVEE